MLGPEKKISLLRKLSAFQLTNFEQELLLVLFERGALKVSEILKYIPKPFPQRGPFVYRTLKELSNKKWIQAIQESPKIYALNSKKQIGKIMDDIIDFNLKLIEEQRHAYHEIVESVENAQKHGRVTSNETVELPKNTQPFFKSFIHSIIHHSSLHLFKTECNMIISLQKIFLTFKLNAVEFELIVKNIPHYGGVVFNIFEPGFMKSDALPKIHKYNVNGLNFAYKMEKKGYNDQKLKVRKIINYKLKIIENIEESKPKDIYTSPFQAEIESPKKIEINGSIITTLMKQNRNGIYSYWGENKEIVDILQKELKNLKFD
ncbi:MAG: helix-turn-helix domain-containing protein [Promethearchaeota archaeon]